MQASGCTETTGGTLGCDEAGTSDRSAAPSAATAGMYSAENEHDACGVALVADLAGRRDHSIVRRGLTALLRLEHRGARGAEANTGDGVGILIQVPDEFLREVVDFALPPAGALRGGHRLPARRTPSRPRRAVARIEKLAAEESLRVLGWRDVPTDVDRADSAPAPARRCRAFRQLFVARRDDGADGAPLAGIALERRTYCLRKRAEHETGDLLPACRRARSSTRACWPSRSSRPSTPTSPTSASTSALALVHSRFSTNTFPSWSLAHPYRYVAHNGEINTLRGNRNWMAAREALLASPTCIPGDLPRLSPIVTPDASDSATFDEVLELLHLGGRSLPHAVLMMIPEAWENHARDGPGTPGLLRVPLHADGAVGRPGAGRLHRRHRDRRRARPQRPAPGPLLGHRGRAGRAGLRGRRARRRPGVGRHARAGWSRAGCSSSTPRPAASSTTPRSRARWPPSSRTRTGCTPGWCTSTTCPTREREVVTARPRCASGSRRSATPRRS